ncbi:hypothetical protein BD410DRAFT_84826 [Rickenella mellea]|uniref:F-box domain-containing protein n=1 Tax=Rickenella mellea TaxID=50990 RepID=A0A4Y7PLD7_9AGAM|nr:hypothetical protein BD410DRAFT_84826 [Rickenella mellea]
MPSLSHIECFYWQFQPRVAFATQLTTFEISLGDMETIDIGRLAQALQSLTNLRNLSVQLSDCESVDYGTDWNRLKPHSVQIDKLTIGINEGTVLEAAQGLYDTLSFFTAVTVEISLDNVGGGPQLDYLKTANAEFFPFGTIILLHVSRWIYIPDLFMAIGRSCEIVHTVHFDVPHGVHFTDGFHDQFDHSPFRSIRHVVFHKCDSLREEQVKFMLKHSLFAEVADFKLVSCPKITEDFLLDCRDEFGEKIQWTL